MRRASYLSHFSLLCCLVLLVNLPTKSCDKMRSAVISSISPLWKNIHLATGAAAQSHKKETPHSTTSTTERLKLENHFLRSQMETLRSWILSEERFERQLQTLKGYLEKGESSQGWKDFYGKRATHLRHLLTLEMHAVSAQVVFRDPSLWSSLLWINVGERDNRALGKQIVAKNSPVLSGFAVVGIIEEVKETQSLVRLISDSRISLAVRAVRGSDANRPLVEHLHALLLALDVRGEDFYPIPEEKEEMIARLSRLNDSLTSSPHSLYLAKGELKGGGEPLWRSKGNVLKGVGFNYYFSDEESRPSQEPSLLQAGDLLVTSGLDGVFPADLPIALVIKVIPTPSGTSTYDLEAKSLAENLDELTHCFVLPAVDSL